MPIDSGAIQLTNINIPNTFVFNKSGMDEHINSDCLHVTLLIENQHVTKVIPSGFEIPEVPSVDGAGNIVLPKFTEIHVHLDKCHSIGRLKDVGGDLMAAIEEQAKDKANWSGEDIRRRAERGLQELYNAGCQAVRTHVDWLDGFEPPATWHTMVQIASEWRHKMVVQCAPLIDISLFSDKVRADAMVKQIADADGVLGAFILGHKNLENCLHVLFELARKYDVDVDFHVDEGMNPALNGIEIVADVLEKADFNGNVLCGHVCNLMNYEPARLQPLMEKLRSQNVSIGVLPATNLYLQGRTSGTPDRRGLTRIKELNEFGINVAIGTDNVGDAFCPIGRHDPLNSLSLGVVAAHLDPPFNQWLDCITTNASQAIGLPPTHVDGAPIDKLLITNAKNTAELIAGAMPAPQSIDSFLVEATKNQEIL